MIIPLTQGQVTIVDDEDYWLMKGKWCAAYRRKHFYATHRLGDKNSLMHREIWEHHHEPIPKGMEIDHINGNGLDNRLENLRACTHQQNTFNKHRKPQGVSSKYRGVHWNTRRKVWKAQIYINKVMTYIGYYVSEEEAAKAYDAKARELFGEYACLNFRGEKSD